MTNTVVKFDFNFKRGDLVTPIDSKHPNYRVVFQVTRKARKLSLGRNKPAAILMNIRPFGAAHQRRKRVNARLWRHTTALESLASM